MSWLDNYNGDEMEFRSTELVARSTLCYRQREEGKNKKSKMLIA